MPREVRITTSGLNRYGFRMLTEGGDLEQYKRNNILLFMHFRPYRGTKDEILAIGTVENLRFDGDDLIGTPVFDQSDPFAKQIESKWEAGIYKMVSIGADPIEWSDDPAYMLPGQKYSTITKWRLDEISIADIGANDDAIRLKDNKGHYISLKDGIPPEFLKLIELKPKQTIKKMEKILLALNLGKDATEEQAVAAIQALQNEHQMLQTTLKAESQKAITLAVDTAIRDKRIKEDQKAHFIELGGKVGIELLNKTLSNIEPAIKPNDFIGAGGRKAVTLADKKWADLSAEERVQLRAEDKAGYIKLFKAEYGYEPQID